MTENFTLLSTPLSFHLSYNHEPVISNFHAHADACVFESASHMSVGLQTYSRWQRRIACGASALLSTNYSGRLSLKLGQGVCGRGRFSNLSGVS